MMVYFCFMSERFYPVVLAAISQSGVRLKLIGDQIDYDFFLTKFEKPGTEIKEMKTLQSIYTERLSKIFLEINNWTKLNHPGKKG
jgi:hypothetical protein